MRADCSEEENIKILQATKGFRGASERYKS